MSALSPAMFIRLSGLFYEITGIRLKEYKRYLLEYRLMRLVGPDRRFSSFEELYEALREDHTGELRGLFVHLLTTNYTYFFRESLHFSVVREYLQGRGREEPYVRIWSAGCATGEETYSIAMVVRDALPDVDARDLKILGTDISPEVLYVAHAGVYPIRKVQTSPYDHLLARYCRFDEREGILEVKDEVKRLVTFRRLNLMEPYPFGRMFDVVFLRNVLIYFDLPEKERILSKVYDVVKPEGYLILGLSESLVGVRHRFLHLKASIYSKRG